MYNIYRRPTGPAETEAAGGGGGVQPKKDRKKGHSLSLLTRPGFPSSSAGRLLPGRPGWPPLPAARDSDMRPGTPVLPQPLALESPWKQKGRSTAARRGREALSGPGGTSRARRAQAGRCGEPARARGTLSPPHLKPEAGLREPSCVTRGEHRRGWGLGVGHKPC